MADIYFKNTTTGRRYKVIEFDKMTNEVRLQGDHAEFREPYSKKRFEEMGYVLEKEESDAERS